MRVVVVAMRVSGCEGIFYPYAGSLERGEVWRDAVQQCCRNWAQLFRKGEAHMRRATDQSRQGRHSLAQRPSTSLSRNSLSNSLCWNELQVESGGLFLQPFHLMATVFCFVVFGAFVDVGGAEFQHAIDEPG